MSSTPKLTPFSYVILVLVGERGAGPHDLVQMMRDGRIFWTAPESQFYAEPKRLAEAGYLTATKQPGRTHQRTHYALTDHGKDALGEWLATPARFARVQNEPVVRLLGSEYAERGVLLKSLEALSAELDELERGLAASEARDTDLPHRATVLRLNRRLAQRIIDAHRAWLDDIEQEL
jgi:PadR family transcriptional regulator, regulatory protein AphA